MLSNFGGDLFQSPALPLELAERIFEQSIPQKADELRCLSRTIARFALAASVQKASVRRDRTPQFRDPLISHGDHLENRGFPIIRSRLRSTGRLDRDSTSVVHHLGFPDYMAKLEHRAKLSDQPVRPVHISLVYCEHIRNFQDPRLDRLDIIAHSADDYHHGGMRQLSDFNLVLPYPNGLDAHHIPTHPTHHSDAVPGGAREPSQMAAGRGLGGEQLCLRRLRAHGAPAELSR